MNERKAFGDIPIVILPDDVDLGALVAVAEEPPAAPPQVRHPPPRIPPRPARSGTRGKSPRWSRTRRLVFAAGSLTGVAAVLGLIGFVAFVLHRGYLANYYPSPGALADPHESLARVPGELNCNGCHALTGLTNGCLGCHEEIEGQLSDGQGFHGFLLKGKDADCSRCHHEHLGSQALLVITPSWRGQGPQGFSHPHADFRLVCKHREIGCPACHQEKRRGDVTLPRFPAHPRQHTFLGLQQDCVSCHEDIHSGGLSKDCESCHDQVAFRPAALFDHGRHFPLEGGHSRVACDRCHRIPGAASDSSARRLPFAEVRGTRCAECHDSPHRTVFDRDCIGCHQEAPETWSAGRGGVTDAVHAGTGFVLSPAHAVVPCVKCHGEGGSYAERFQDPSRPGYSRRPETCEGCHREVHGGQFAEKGMTCVDCHELEQFKPHRFGRLRHAGVFPLAGAHAQAECEGCHKEDPDTRVRRFAGTSRDCRTCHQDPHGGQFEAAGRSCSECHDPRRFVPAAFGHAAHDPVFPLAGSHRAVPCASCHVKDARTGARRFVGTTRSCKGCHADPHGGQFATDLAAGDCTSCHRRDAESFAIGRFDHEGCAGFVLVGAHANAKCNQCHVEREARAGPEHVGSMVRVFRGTSRRCSSCHRDVHLGQFRGQGDTDCARCHDPAARWPDLRFEHNKQARFPLDGVHASVPCAGCHRTVPLSDGGSVKLFKPLGASCNDCHTVVPK